MSVRDLFQPGRVFYGIAIFGLGCQMVYYDRFPYMLVPPKTSWIPGIAWLVYIVAIFFIATGLCIIFKKNTRSVTLLLGTPLLLIFLFGFIPYEIAYSPNYMHLLDWDNAGKELALAAGALVIAACFAKEKENMLFRLLGRLTPFGAILFSVAMVSFGLLHFLYAKGVAEYAPSWVPHRVFWVYLGGGGLVSSGLAIILNIKRGLAATILGTMIFIWVIILHTPKVFTSPALYVEGELTSGLIALAYSGTAFVIAAEATRLKAQETAPLPITNN